MLWSCIYIKDIKVKFDRMENVRSQDFMKLYNMKDSYAVFKCLESDNEYRISTSKSSYSKGIKNLEIGDVTLIQSMILKKGCDYRSEIGFANDRAYNDFNRLSDSERSFYECRLNEIKDICLEDALSRTKTAWRGVVMFSSMAIICAVTVLSKV